MSKKKVYPKRTEIKGPLLPSQAWLKRNGFGGLVSCMQKHPELFEHIDKENKIKSNDEVVKMAEGLAEENDGILPAYNWLRNNGCVVVYARKRRYPELFAHIEQAYSGGRNLKENVELAEEMAEDNGGILPTLNKLAKNMGLYGLAACVRKYPEEFSHIEQEKTKKKIVDHLKRAEQIVSEFGFLPNQKHLRENGDADLVSCVRKNPGEFSHIKQEKLYRSIGENVELAELLAKKNGGILPPYIKIKKMGHISLAELIRLKPEYFSHLKQEKMRKTLKQHIVDAEELERIYGQVPNCSWLKDHGKSDLHMSMVTYPEKYAHLKRKRLKKTTQEHVKKAIELEIHQGCVPTHTWLRNNNLLDLSMCISHHPDKFKGIKQAYYYGRSERIRYIGECA